MPSQEGFHHSRDNDWDPNSRQREVLDLLVEGKTNAEIAAATGMTLDGAKWHISELMVFTGLENRYSLAAWWRENRERNRHPFVLPLTIMRLSAALLLPLAIVLFLALRDDGGGQTDLVSAIDESAAADFAPPESDTAVRLQPDPSCPVTQPNGNTPPGERPSPGHLGNGVLWTGLYPNGVVPFSKDGPGSINPDGSLEMKFGWWRAVGGNLVIEGKRLDADAPPLEAHIPDGYGASGFQATGLVFASPGCWEVTGRVGEHSLTFITFVTLQE